jgi:serine protease Do
MTPMNPSVSASISVGEQLAEVVERLRRSTVEVRGPEGGRGSGVIWRPGGLIVTNAHVATSSPQTVKLSDGRVFQAELVRREPRYDLASLQISATALPAAQTRDAASLRPGELVLAVGNPLEANGAFTCGVVSATPQPSDVLVRADIRLAPGNSGGPLADAHGRVVGINCMVVGGFGVAVNSNVVQRLLAGDQRRSIGVSVQPVSLRGAGLPALGLRVVALETGGAAHLSGVLIGDVIVRASGKSLNSAAQLSEQIQVAAHPLSLGVLREGRLEVCEVTLAGESIAEVA